ncbi:MAG TPA: ribosome recycling factor [Patescibacteria group bacterium]|jgi:ribosome recycling factor|nr:ribosome recycling factor [Patescibacteria group bacterium]
MFDAKLFEVKINQTISHFEDDLKKIRTGRAHASMLDGIAVEVYGTKVPLNQTANVVAVESQLLQITPFDQSNLQAIVSSIRDNQNLGLNPSDDGRVVRVPIPQLTTERRAAIAKQLSSRVEDCRIVLRNIRHDAIRDAKKAKDDKQITEDDLKRVEKTLDGFMDTAQTKIEALAKTKEIEIMTI